MKNSENNICVGALYEVLRPSSAVIKYNKKVNNTIRGSHNVYTKSKSIALLINYIDDKSEYKIFVWLLDNKIIWQLLCEKKFLYYWRML